MPDEIEWLSPKELAALVGVHEQTVYRAVRRGDLAASRIGAAWRIPWPQRWTAPGEESEEC